MAVTKWPFKSIVSEGCSITLAPSIGAYNALTTVRRKDLRIVHKLEAYFGCVVIDLFEW